MHLPVISLPRAVPTQSTRPPQANIPQTRAERDQITAIVRGYVERYRPVPPMPIPELREHADRIVAAAGLDPAHRDYIGVIVSNEAWRDTLATIPYERRLLLMPKCLRVEARCPAPFDEFGLLCKKCGLCSIQDLQSEAERLGYAVLVAEGSAIVMSIIETGKIEAIVGVSCLSVLERAFPQMEAAAIPGIAIPLLQDDCIDTNVDTDAVWDVIHLTSDDKTYRLDLDGIRHEVQGWFEAASLDRLMGPPDDETGRIAREWLVKAGKRWRPFLTACAYLALRDDPDAPVDDAVRRAAVAVECFHKASLIHDDIEDQDQTRYGEAALHEAYGVAVALNVGDYLLGEGYRLLAELDAPAEAKVEMLRAAAAGHRTLTEGQGMELLWTRAPKVLTSLQVLDIFRRKTAPAFEVALRVGGALAGASEDVRDVFAKYSEALGIAYQIRDDIDDLTGTDAPDDIAALRPSLPLAVGVERAKGQHEDAHAALLAAWKRDTSDSPDALRARLIELNVEDRCRRLLDSYKEEAIRSLAVLDEPTLKGLLRRIVGKIFNDIELKGWCSEFEARNAAGRALGADAAAVVN
ncbi:MAG: polyprenyl synthetase family protein [Vicinamibacteraceae bacterium]